MTVTIELNSQDEARLSSAARLSGIDPADLAKKLVIEHLPRSVAAVPDAENQAAIDLLRAWREEDATDDEEELIRRDIETEELLSNIRANRFSL